MTCQFLGSEEAEYQEERVIDLRYQGIGPVSFAAGIPSILPYVVRCLPGDDYITVSSLEQSIWRNRAVSVVLNLSMWSCVFIGWSWNTQYTSERS